MMIIRKATWKGYILFSDQLTDAVGQKWKTKTVIVNTHQKERKANQ